MKSYLRAVARETFLQTRRAQLPLVASSLSYTTILSMIPLLAVSFAIFQTFGGLDKVYGVVEPFIVNNLAEGTGDQVIALIKRIISNAHASTIGITGLLGLIFTSMSMLSSIERAINQVWNSPLTRSWFARLSGYWFFITIGPLALAVGLGVATSADFPLVKLFPSGSALMLVEIAFFYFIYKWVPHTKVDHRFALISAIFTSIALALARWAWLAYVGKAVSYNRIYGSLAAIPIMLLWIYIVWLVVLAGAAFTASLQAVSSRNKIS